MKNDGKLVCVAWSPESKGPAPLMSLATMKRPSISKQNEDNDSSTSPGAAKRNRRHKAAPLDPNMPRRPACGYSKFYAENRPRAVAQNPGKAPHEITAILGRWWREELTDAERKAFNDRFDEEMKEYRIVMAQYKRTDAYKAVQTAKKAKEKEKEISAKGEAIATSSSANFTHGPEEIPIFTQEFLDLNRARESELRQLRTQVIQSEEELNAITAHVDKIRRACGEVEKETGALREENQKTRRRLDEARKALVAAFKNLPLPGTKEIPNLETIDDFMAKLQRIILEQPEKHVQFISQARAIAGRLSLH